MRPTIQQVFATLLLATVMVGMPAGRAEAAGTTPTKCQKAVVSAAPRYLQTKLKAMGTCTDAAFKCVQLERDVTKRSECLKKAGTKCLSSFTKIAIAEIGLISSIGDLATCGSLPPADLFGSQGLNFDKLKKECESQFDTDLTDVGSVAKCILLQYSCQADALFDVQRPRALELVRLALAEAGFSKEAVDDLIADTMPCLSDNGGEGGRLEDLQIAGTLVKCDKKQNGDGTTFTVRSLKGVAKCTSKVFSCVHGKAERRAKCLEKARAGCLTSRVALEKLRGKVIPGRCALAALDSTLPFDAVNSPSGANHLALSCQCAAVDVQDVKGFAADAVCLERQHECRASELLSIAMPRAAELLALVTLTSEDFLCPSTSKSSRAGGFTGVTRAASDSHGVITGISAPGLGPASNIGGSARLGKGRRQVRSIRARRRILAASASQVILDITSDAKRLRIAARDLKFGRLLDDYYEMPLSSVGANGLPLVAKYPSKLDAACFELAFVTIDAGGVVSAPIFLKQDEVPPPDSSAVLHLKQVQEENVGNASGLQGVRAVTVSRDGQFVYVASASNTIGFCAIPVDPLEPYCSSGSQCPVDGICNKNKTTPDGVVLFKRDVATGRVTYVSHCASDPTKFCASDGDCGVGTCGISGPSIVGPIGAKPSNPLSLTTGPDDSFLHVAYSGANRIITYKRDNLTTGAHTVVETIAHGQNGVTGLVGVRVLVVSPNGVRLYSAADDSNALTVFGRNVATGTLTFIKALTKDLGGGFEGLEGVNGLAVSPDGKNLYTTTLKAGKEALSVFDLVASPTEITFRENHKTGLQGVVGMEKPRDVSISPDGKFVYVTTGAGGNNIAVFARNTTTGALSFVEVQTDLTGQLEGFRPTSAIVSPDGKYLFAAGGTGPDVNGDGPDRTVTVFQRDQSTGRLTFIKNAGGTHVTEGVSLAADKLTKNLYATGERTNSFAVFDVCSPPGQCAAQ